MKQYRILFFILIILVFSCEKEEDLKVVSNKVEFTSITCSDVSYTHAKVSSSIPETYGLDIDEFGHCWSTDSLPDLNDSISVFTEYSKDTITTHLTGLKQNTTYFTRTYFKSGEIISYSDDISFQTLKVKKPAVEIEAFFNLGVASVDVLSRITDSSELPISSRGLVFYESSSPEVKDTVFPYWIGGGQFKTKIDSLKATTQYTISAFAINEVGVSYGPNIDILTEDGIIDLQTHSVTEITAFSAKTGGSYTNDEGLEIIEKGICWNGTGNPTVEDNKKQSISEDSSFVETITGLTENTQYFVRAYVINEVGISYGDEIEFSTNDITIDIQIIQLLDLDMESLNINVNLYDSGGLKVLENGICWNTNGDPIINDSVTTTYRDHSILSGGTKNYIYHLENLNSNTTYYVRPFIRNEYGVFYGGSQNFTTKDGILDITTIEITEVGMSSASTGGVIDDDEGLEILEKGICWNISGNPKIGDNKKINSSEYNSFVESITGLTENTQYYVRAYAINEIGVSYGNELVFTTSDGRPTIKTKELTEITYDSLKTGGEIISDQGSPITEKGVCWNNTGNPTVSDMKQNIGSGLNDFTCYINNLQAGETYYIRAYAVNSVGTAYGNELSVTMVEENLSVRDYDGNWYKTVKIGDQFWLKENLKTTHFQNGDLIETTNPITLDISGEVMPKYQWVYNGDESNVEIYGRLYTRYVAVDSRNVCPDGWHVPSESEFWELYYYLINNGYNYDGTTSGNKIGKSLASKTNWILYPYAGGVPGNNPEGNNSSGFSGQPSGARVNFNDFFSGVGEYTYWWSTNVDTYDLGIAFQIQNSDMGAYISSIGDVNTGAPIRCIKD